MQPVQNLNIDEDNKIVEICKKYSVSSIVSKVLLARDIQDIKSFLHPDIFLQWENPNNIKGLPEVVDDIEIAIRKGQKILVFGDYDLDGISSTVIMKRAILDISKRYQTGTTVNHYIPDRFSEGYGITPNAISSIRKMEKPDLVITVDCGISCKDEISFLQKLGVRVVVTDHHESSGSVPKNIHWVNPKVSGGPSSILAGAGVALKVIQALGARFGMPHYWLELSEFATFGTIADIMPLTGQNRALVAYGINRINNNPRACINRLLCIAGKEKNVVTSTDIGWSISPRLNSAGRLNKPDIAIELLMSDDVLESQKLAQQLEVVNDTRKLETDKLEQIVMARAEIIFNNNPDLRSLVLAGEAWHEGVRGIVAAKIANRFKVPAIVLSIDGEEAHGSARSFGSVDIHEAIVNNQDLLLRFGGHQGAAGMSLKIENLEAFANGIEDYMQKLDTSMFEDKPFVDCSIKLSEISVDNVKSLSLLEPFGCDNERPVFVLNNIFIKNARAVGSEGNHLSCWITDGYSECSAIMFNVDNIEKYLNNNQLAKLYATLELNEFRGRVSPKLFIKKILFSDEYDLVLLQDESSEICDVNVQIPAQTDEVNFDSSKLANIRHNWESIAQNNPKKLRKEILKAMIGDGSLHDSQAKTLDILEKGKSALAVLPTGRGKSLIFQIFAATIALKDHKTSLFVYPLRALIADQAFHLSNTFGKFGLRSIVLCGQTPNKERDEILLKLSQDYYDIVLTTPEFLDIHCDEFALNAKIGFIVLDESHHIGEVKVGQRISYGNMPTIIDKLENPQVLALSATVSKDVYCEITKYLPISELITDEYERNNLFIDDKRNITSKDDYLTSIVGSGQKTVIYANSREQTIAIARMLKSRCHHIAMNIGFYNAGMSKSQRKQIEEYFRDNKLCCLVATSAFGEGVNIPDIRHVCLYHLPFSDVEFNQMSGRAGRDGAPALIHLLYSQKDAQINSNILSMSNPNRNDLANVYRWLRVHCQDNNNFEFTREEIDEMYENGKSPAMYTIVDVCVTIFEELRLISKRSQYKNDTTVISVSFCEERRVELESSSRYLEGINQITEFEHYRDFATSASVQKLQTILRHPIIPK